MDCRRQDLEKLIHEEIGCFEGPRERESNERVVEMRAIEEVFGVVPRLGHFVSVVGFGRGY